MERSKTKKDKKFVSILEAFKAKKDEKDKNFISIIEAFKSKKNIKDQKFVSILEAFKTKKAEEDKKLLSIIQAFKVKEEEEEENVDIDKIFEAIQKAIETAQEIIKLFQKKSEEEGNGFTDIFGGILDGLTQGLSGLGTIPGITDQKWFQTTQGILGGLTGVFDSLKGILFEEEDEENVGVISAPFSITVPVYIKISKSTIKYIEQLCQVVDFNIKESQKTEQMAQSQKNRTNGTKPTN